MQEIKVDIAPMSANDDEKEYEEKMEAATLTEKMKLVKSLESFLQYFDRCGHFAKWKDSMGQLLEDFQRLTTLTSSVEPLHSENGKAWAEDEIEALKSARTALVSSKKGVFYEALTLFPVGAFVQQCAAKLVTGFLHDKGLYQELDQVVLHCGSLKTFTADILLKKNDKDITDIQIPSMAKLAEVVTKYLYPKIKTVARRTIDVTIKHNRGPSIVTE